MRFLKNLFQRVLILLALSSSSLFASNYLVTHNGRMAGLTHDGNGNVTDIYLNNGPATLNTTAGDGPNVNQFTPHSSSWAKTTGTFNVGGVTFNSRYSVSYYVGYAPKIFIFSTLNGVKDQFLFCGGYYNPTITTLNTTWATLTYTLRNPSSTTQTFNIVGASGLNYYSPTIPNYTQSTQTATLMVEAGTNTCTLGSATTTISGDTTITLTATADHGYIVTHNERIAGVSHTGTGNVNDIFLNDGPATLNTTAGDGPNVNQFTPHSSSWTKTTGTFYVNGVTFNSRYSVNYYVGYAPKIFIFSTLNGVKDQFLFCGGYYNPTMTSLNTTWATLTYTLRNPSSATQTFNIVGSSGLNYYSPTVANYTQLTQTATLMVETGANTCTLGSATTTISGDANITLTATADHGYIVTHNERISGLSHTGTGNVNDIFLNDGPATLILTAGDGTNVNQFNLHSSSWAKTTGTFYVNGVTFNSRYSVNIYVGYAGQIFMFSTTGGAKDQFLFCGGYYGPSSTSLMAVPISVTMSANNASTAAQTLQIPGYFATTVNASTTYTGSFTNFFVPTSGGVASLSTSTQAVTPTTASISLRYPKSSQTITFAALPTLTWLTTTSALTATASSGLPVTYASSNTSVATVQGSTLTITGIGSTTITASQAGNGVNNAATNVSQALTVQPAALTLSGLTIANKTYDGTTAATVQGSPSLSTQRSTDTVQVSGTPVGTYSSSNVGNNLSVTLSGLTLTGTNADNYVLVLPVLTASISQSSQSLTFPNVGQPLMGIPIILTATATSGLAVTYTVTGPATMNGSIVTATGAGTVSITASQSGNASYTSATPISQSFTIVPQNVTITPITQTVDAGQSVTFTASGASGTTAYVWSGADVLTATGTTNTVVFNVAGTRTVQVTNPANANYATGSAVATIIVNPALSSNALISQVSSPTNNLIPLSITPSGGSGTYTFQWYRNTQNSTTDATPIADATTSTYLPPSDEGTFYYYVIIGDGLTSLTSNIAAITVPPLVIMTQPVGSTVSLPHTPGYLSVVAGQGMPPYTYQWFSNAATTPVSGTLITNATADLYVPDVTNVGTYYYYAVVTDAQGASVTTNVVTENITPLLSLTQSSDAIDISWSPFPGASSYHVIRTDAQGNQTPWDVYGAVPFHDTTGVPNLLYTYTVSAQTTSGIVPLGGFSSVTRVVPILPFDTITFLPASTTRQWYQINVTDTNSNLYRFFTAGMQGTTHLTVYSVVDNQLVSLISDNLLPLPGFSNLSYALPAGSYYLLCEANTTAEFAIRWRLAEAYTSFTMGILDAAGARVAGDCFYIKNTGVGGDFPPFDAGPPNSFGVPTGLPNGELPYPYLDNGTVSIYKYKIKSQFSSAPRYYFEGSCLGMACYARWYFLFQKTPPLFTAYISDGNAEKVTILHAHLVAGSVVAANLNVQHQTITEYCDGQSDPLIIRYIITQLSFGMPCVIAAAEPSDPVDPDHPVVYDHAMLAIGFQKTYGQGTTSLPTGTLFVYNNPDNLESEVRTISVVDGVIQTPTAWATKMQSIKYVEAPLLPLFSL